MKRVKKRALQILRHGPAGIFRLGYNLWIAPWAHVAALPTYEIKRRQLLLKRSRSDFAARKHALQARLDRRPTIEGWSRLSRLDPALEAQVAPLRHVSEEIVLAELDQDGFALPVFGSLWDAPQVDSLAFVPRVRNRLFVVDRGDAVGIRKSFDRDIGGFLNEVEAGLDLHDAGCNVPTILAVDWERQSVTHEYIRGSVVRETLAAAGVPIRNREVANPGSRRTTARAQAVARKILPNLIDPQLVASLGEALLAIHRAGYALTDIKYGNIIIQKETGKPYFIDFERALPLADLPQQQSVYIRDHDIRKFNAHFGTDLLTAHRLRTMHTVPGGETEAPRAAWGSYTGIYAPIEVGAGIRWGPIWNTDVGIGRWRYIMADHLPIPQGGSILDIGANNGFNALQMLRAGAGSAIAIEIDPRAIEQGEFLKLVYEWADNRAYDFSYIRGSHGELAMLGLPPRFDLVTAFCTLYYLNAAQMALAVEYIATLTDTFVMQANTDRLISRSDESTFERASLEFTEGLMRRHGFPNIRIVAPKDYSRPLLIGRKS